MIQIPYIPYGWGAAYFNTSIVRNFFYNLPDELLYVSYPNGQFDIFYNVPQSIAKKLNYTPSPDLYYQKTISQVYGTLLLTENCIPLKTETGVLLAIK